MNVRGFLSLSLCLIALSSARGSITYLSQDRSVSASNSRGSAADSVAPDFSPFNATADVTWERTVPPEWQGQLLGDGNTYSAAGRQESALTPYGISAGGDASETGPFFAFDSYDQSSASSFEVTFETAISQRFTLTGELYAFGDYGGTCQGWYETWVELSGPSGDIFTAGRDGAEGFAGMDPLSFDEMFWLEPGLYTLRAGATASGWYYFDDPWPGIGGGGSADYSVQFAPVPIPAPAALWLGLIGTSLGLRLRRWRS
jgi:hypothetical protein